MLADWFTVIAQIINFLILVGLLKYFLYGRIVAAMEARQQKIEDDWHDAELAKKDAEQEALSIRRKNLDMDEQREKQLAQVRDEVEQHRHELVAKARSEVDQLKSRWTEGLREETDSFLRDLRGIASKEICSIARRALADLADQELESCTVRVFINRLKTVGQAERDKIAAYLLESGGDVLIQSAFEITADQRSEVVEALRQAFDCDLDVRFEVTSDLMCGIAMHTDSHRVAWELNDYLDGLEEQILAMLDVGQVSNPPTATPADILAG